MINQLKPEHSDMVLQYLDSVKNKTANSYMLTIARDGESPVRTIIFYGKYFDWGFAKQYLTVTLYEPSGKVHQKVLTRNQAGECTFVRQDYVDIENILLSFKDNIEKDIYDDLAFKIMKVFAKDSWRFDPERFLSVLKVEKTIDS